MRHAQRPDKIAFRVRAGRGINLKTQHRRNLNRGQSHAARGAVNQNAFAFPSTRKVNEGVPRRKKRHGHGRRFGPREVRRFRDRRPRFRHNFGCKARRSKSRHGVSGHKLRDGRPHFGHDACGFHPHRGARKAVLQRFFRQHSHGPHDVTEIKSRRLHRHADFVRGQRFPFGTLPTEALQLPRRFKRQDGRQLLLVRQCTHAFHAGLRQTAGDHRHFIRL